VVKSLLHPSQHKQLFLDDHAVHSTSGVRRHLHPADKQGAVLRPDRSRGQKQTTTRSVPQWNSDKQLWEWWYNARYFTPELPVGMTCNYATSTDLLDWEAPSLGLFEFNGSRDNSIAGDPTQRRLYHIVRDERDPDPARRYKGLFDTRDRWLGVSPDGFDWTMLDVSPIPSQDESHFLYDEYTEQYLAFVKQPTEWGRSVYLSTSTDFERFSFPKLVFNTDETDNRNRLERIQRAIDDPEYLTPPVVAGPDYSVAQCYQMAVLPYEGIYVGFPVLYNPAGPDGLGNDTGLNQVELTVSRDLYRWDRVADRALFIGIDPWDGGSYGTAQNVLCGRPIVRDDEIWVFYNAFRIRDNKELYWEQDRYGFIDTELFKDVGALHLAKLRLDGFVSLDADGDGEVVTEPFVWDGRTLHVNVDAPGALRAELLDADAMTPLSGHSAAECNPVSGDHLSAPVTWSGGPHGEQKVRARFTLRDARLFAFWIA